MTTDTAEMKCEMENAVMKIETERLKMITKDLRREAPRSPHDKLGGYVTAARILDKCRSTLLGVNGEYDYWPCSLAREFFAFTGLTPERFQEFTATGADDQEIAEWLREAAIQRAESEVIRWNNRMRNMRVSEMSDKAQEFLETYIPKYIPRNRRVYTFFDVFDIEEKRI
jgi:Domain of unknown function (DUF5069)